MILSRASPEGVYFEKELSSGELAESYWHSNFALPFSRLTSVNFALVVIYFVLKGYWFVLLPKLAGMGYLDINIKRLHFYFIKSFADIKISIIHINLFLVQILNPEIIHCDIISLQGVLKWFYNLLKIIE